MSNKLPDDCWIGLLSGAQMNYNFPEKSDVTLDDLASALSNICRFSGHLPVFYSVAQHLVNTSRIVEPEFAFDALMHDTSEAFTNDLPTPLKWAFPIFKTLEEKIEAAMADRFGFNYPYPPAVKVADTEMLLLEKKYVKLDDREWPHYNGIEFEHQFEKVDLKGWQPCRAKREFLERYEELTRDRVARTGLQRAA
jgi:5'-deoxynucleotidase YfbR-like HD superfamily hydrolase